MCPDGASTACNEPCGPALGPDQAVVQPVLVFGPGELGPGPGPGADEVGPGPGEVGPGPGKVGSGPGPANVGAGSGVGALGVMLVPAGATFGPGIAVRPGVAVICGSRLPCPAGGVDLAGSAVTDVAIGVRTSVLARVAVTAGAGICVGVASWSDVGLSLLPRCGVTGVSLGGIAAGWALSAA